MTAATVVLVPGLRGHVEDHWQTRLAATLPGARTVPPLGRTDPDLRARVDLLDRVVAEADGPVVVVAHSAGVLTTVHWAATYEGTAVVGALLVTPPALADPLPAGYPSIAQLRASGWLPVPRRRLPFPSILAVSSDDPLGNPVRLRALAAAWGSRVHPLGAVGHLNPASGFGNWPEALPLVDELGDGAGSPGADPVRGPRPALVPA
ncbi:RBBP9/YdeN family alpha/beta hydrolase [Geodermatophilus marinus]|uniref:RBBP9/YdeN family alpha/beta hydrolase n=1 Tax=Geodermatophilus sp. LHW52908 TaxID=2303986 RepID=UPI000E3DC95D|nr:alpha/beta hydrolase [Geodermatophilus sp. LHW52908]RFU19672.1 alpha/beta hydrolase [Geodermatophilus sp. LHW52908]